MTLLPNICDRHKDLIYYLLNFEHRSVAMKLGFIEECDIVITDGRLFQAIGVIDYYSRNSDEESKQMVIVLSSILYTYKQNHWTGLNEFLVIVLSRIGFAPSAIMVDESYDKESNQFSA